MGLTGIFQWYPSLVTQILPGIVVPMARLIHMLEAILAVLAIAIWHSYHTMIKERNLSIFTGYMTEHEMQENHTLEYRRIMKARDFIKDLQTGQSAAAKAKDEKAGETTEQIEEPAAQAEEPTVQADGIVAQQTAE
jgi:hypothetical protein